MNTPVLYYRPGCSHCDRILKLVRRRPRIKLRVAHVREARDAIQGVPAIVVYGRPPLIGRHAFDYVNAVTESNNNMDTFTLLLIAFVVVTIGVTIQGNKRWIE